ncbi:MAG: type II secretion system F family protein [Hamadaea sp.]|nr:type II secretion system F family protein [Hamadaea sp.]NUR46897.1 type II secretion system F family protein [Hamadaea sp.]NUT07935.1 type II secretion system F family protein [Hamadaea sp.]
MVFAFVGLGAIFLAICVGAITLISAGVGRTGVAKALASIDQVYAPGSSSPAEESIRDRAVAPAAQRLAGLGRTFTPKGVTAKIQRWLDYAGNPPAWPPERVMEMQGIGLLVFAVVGFLLALGGGRSLFGLILWTIVAGAAGFWLPIVLLYNAGLRRQMEIRLQLPDAMDLLTLSVEAGLGFEAAIAQVASTMPGAVAREFARMLHEMQMGQRRADALRALSERTTVIELRSIATSLLQATELGIPIADVLREQSREMRVKRRQNAEAAAAKVPVKVVFPLVFCLLPALFVVVIGPGAIRIMESFR